MTEPPSPNRPHVLRLWARLLRPHFLLGGVLMYLLGWGMVRYLGLAARSDLAWMGLGWVMTMQASAHLLNEYFDAPLDLDNLNRTLFSGGSGALGPDALPRAVAFWSALILLTATATFTLLIIHAGTATISVVLIMALIATGAIGYSVPPLRLLASGYGELTTSVLVASLVPTFAFLLQQPRGHALLAITTTPLVLLHLAMMLAFELPDYATDLKHEKRTLMVRLGWQNGMLLHNGLLAAGYVALALGLNFGLPWAVGAPVFFTLPLALFQMFQIRTLAQGARPRWTLLTFTALAVFGLSAYLLTFGFWTR